MSARRARLVQALASRLGAQTVPALSEAELEVDVRADDLPAAQAQLAAERARLLAAYGSDERHLEGGSFRVRFVYEVEGEDLILVVRAALDAHKPAFPSGAAGRPALEWAEREMRELLGFEPRGHPDPRPLLLDRPGTTPLRKDFAPGASLAPAPPARPPVVVEGEGTYEVTLGPGATGIGEAACLRIAAFGDRVIHFEPLLFRKHRGAEKRAEGLSPRKAVVLAERLCGSCSVANAAALTLAIERLARSEPPARATWMRTAAIELERILSHAAALGAACAAAGWGAAEGLFLRARERLLAAVEEALGSRLLRGIVAPGGVRRDLEAGPARSLARAVRGAAAALGRASDAVVASASLRQRLEGLGAVSPALAVELDLLGPSARASGSRRDARRDHPHLAYPELRFWVPVYVAGDALARFRVRTDEVEQSCAVVAEVLEGLPEGRTAVEVGPPAPAGRALGVVESARGLTLHALHTDGRGAIDRWHVRAPSQTGWRALAAAAPGCVLEDLALLHTSFDLCVSCVDR